MKTTSAVDAARLGEVWLDAAPVPLGELVLGDGRQEARGGPAFPVRLLCELGPDDLDGGPVSYTHLTLPTNREV